VAAIARRIRIPAFGQLTESPPTTAPSLSHHRAGSGAGGDDQLVEVECGSVGKGHDRSGGVESFRGRSEVHIDFVLSEQGRGSPAR
jgi:hypothetical protein